MSWIKEKDERSWVQKLCTQVLIQGPVPKHVGFILDGNRRYARGRNLQNIEGHQKGFDKLAETLRWCLDMGITEVTVYVFSIENFKRSEEEVAALMNLAKEKFQKLIDEEDRIMEEGVCIQIVGDWSLIPVGLRQLMAKAMTMTRYNSRAKLNVAFAYTSRNEITRGIRSINQGLLTGDIEESDICCQLLEDSFHILPSKPLDLLVRTSGESRLSDFLLWQSSNTVLAFANVLWPEFSYWHLLLVIFQYQVDKMNLVNQNLRNSCLSEDDAVRHRQEQFIHKIREKQWQTVVEEASQV